MQPWLKPMDNNSNTSPANFAEIKQNLDPSSDYIIFEKNGTQEDGADFSEVDAFMTRYKQAVITQAVHHDPTGKHHLLVVELNVDDLGDISQEIVNLTLPEDVTVYVYGRRPGIDAA